MSARDDRERWNEKHARGGEHAIGAPIDESIQHLERGRLLDLACGTGRHAMFLARSGWTVTAVDLSDVGLTIARERSQAMEVEVGWVQADAARLPLKPGSFDTVMVRYFLDRALWEDIARLLRRGGTLYYQTFTKGELPDRYKLKSGEMKRIFSKWEILEYREVDEGAHGYALLIARRP